MVCLVFIVIMDMVVVVVVVGMDKTNIKEKGNIKKNKNEDGSHGHYQHKGFEINDHQ